MVSFITTQQCRRFAMLPVQERRCLLHSAIAVTAARLALLVLPFRWIQARVEARVAGPRRPGGIPPSRWVWAVQAAARRIPGASCLTQALALQWLLARDGRNVTIRVGVAKDGAAGFESHAWVESEGKILLGGDEPLDRFAAILTLPAQAP